MENGTVPRECIFGSIPSGAGDHAALLPDLDYCIRDKTDQENVGSGSRLR